MVNHDMLTIAKVVLVMLKQLQVMHNPCKVTIVNYQLLSTITIVKYTYC